MQSRRQFLQTTVLGGGAAALFPNSLVAQANNAFSFEADGKVRVAGLEVPVDIALLGPNGEATAGFYASLDPFHGQPFSQGWRTVYDYLLKNGPMSSAEDDIDRVVTHVTIHGISKNDLEDVYRKAKQVWDENPHLRVNSGQQGEYSNDNHGDEIIDANPHLHHDHN